VIPLTDSDFKLLPIQFCVDPGECFAWGKDELAPGVKDKLQVPDKKLIDLLREYLEVVFIPLASSPTSGNTSLVLEL